MSPSMRRQRGIGLIEVLVALVVVSFGVLGMAGLQLTGMKHSTSGFNRSKALLHAENMATRMRINAAGVLAGDYAAYDTATGAAQCDLKPAPYCQASQGIDAAECDTDQLADFDLWSVACGEWGTADASGGVLDALPEGRLQIDCGAAPCAADAMYAITVEWNEGSTTSDDPDDVDLKRVQMRLRP